MRRYGALLLLGLALGLPARAQEARLEADPWLGPDKALHFGVSAGLSASGYVATRVISRERGALPFIVGGGLALGAGAAKELFDLTGRGHPSWKDFTWDVVGATTGLLLSWLVDWLLFDVPMAPAATVSSRRSAPSPFAPAVF